MPRLKNSRHEQVAQMKAKSYLQENPPSDIEIVKKAYGYTYDVAHGNASRIIANDSIAQRTTELLTEAIPANQLAKMGKELSRFRKYITNKDGKVIAKIPDGNIRLETWKTLLKMHGVLKDGVSIDNRKVSINMGKEDIERLSECVNSMQKLADQLQLKRQAKDSTIDKQRVYEVREEGRLGEQK